MWQLLKDDVVAQPSLTPDRGQLALAAGTGPRRPARRSVVGEAAERFERFDAARRTSGG
jgi:hypothetical protein